MQIHELFEEAEDKPKELYSPYTDEAEIPADSYPLVLEKINALNKRAAKLKVPPVQLQITGEIFKDMRKDPDLDPYGDTPKRQMKFFKVKVIGESPKLAGWKFIATIEHKDAGNIIRAVPGHPVSFASVTGRRLYTATRGPRSTGFSTNMSLLRKSIPPSGLSSRTCRSMACKRRLRSSAGIRNWRARSRAGCALRRI